MIPYFNLKRIQMRMERIDVQKMYPKKIIFQRVVKKPQTDIYKGIPSPLIRPLLYSIFIYNGDWTSPPTGGRYEDLGKFKMFQFFNKMNWNPEKSPLEELTKIQGWSINEGDLSLEGYTLNNKPIPAGVRLIDALGLPGGDSLPGYRFELTLDPDVKNLLLKELGFIKDLTVIVATSLDYYNLYIDDVWITFDNNETISFGQSIDDDVWNQDEKEWIGGKIALNWELDLLILEGIRSTLEGEAPIKGEMRQYWDNWTELIETIEYFRDDPDPEYIDLLSVYMHSVGMTSDNAALFDVREETNIDLTDIGEAFDDVTIDDFIKGVKAIFDPSYAGGLKRAELRKDYNFVVIPIEEEEQESRIPLDQVKTRFRDFMEATGLTAAEQERGYTMVIDRREMWNDWIDGLWKIGEVSDAIAEMGLPEEFDE